MSPTVEYHCLNCSDNTVSRDFDVSHVSLSCDACGEFGRFVNGAVLETFETFEESPPEDLDWDRLARTEKFVVAERLARTTRTLDDIEVTVHDDRV